jgi:hypothetical protein
MTTVLGLRCSNTDYYFVVMRGTKKTPSIEANSLIQYPEGFKKAVSLKWMVDEVKDKLKKYKIEKVVMKGPEPAAFRTSSLLERIEYEAAVYIACCEIGLKAVFKKVKATIAKDLGLKGKGKYLKTLNTSVIANYASLPEKGQEAAMAAWSELG